MKRGVYYKVSLIYMDGEEATSAVFVTRSDAYSAFNALVDALKEVIKVDVAKVKMEEIRSIVEDSVAERYWEFEHPPGDIKSVLLEDFFVDNRKAVGKGGLILGANTTPDPTLCVSFELCRYLQSTRWIYTYDTCCIMQFIDPDMTFIVQNKLQEVFGEAVICYFARLHSRCFDSERISMIGSHIEEGTKKMQWAEDRGTLRAFKI